MKMNLLKSEKLLAVVMTAFACICMWGCTDVDFKWSDGRGTPSIAGFIDDSLVVVSDCRGWLETTETWSIGDGYSEKSSCGHDRLLVYNYRVQEDGPRWTDSLKNKSGGYRWYQLTDSVFWRWAENDILLWKLGEKAHEMKILREKDGCTQDFEIDRMHQWLGGNFIALGGNLSVGGDSCQYAVLDTVAGTLTYKRLDKDLGWIKKCDDVRAWGEKIFCLFEDVANKNVLLYIDDALNDSLFWDDYKNYGIYPDEFMGDMLRLGHHICSFSNGRLSKYPDIRSMHTEIKFIDSNNNIITY